MARKKVNEQWPLLRALLGKDPSKSGAWGVITRNAGISRATVPMLFPEHYDLDEIEGLYFRDNKEKFLEEMKDYILVEIRMEVVGLCLALPVNFPLRTRSLK